MRLGKRHGVAALAAALLVHAGAVAMFLHQRDKSGAEHAGIGGLSISLSSAGGALGEVLEEVSPEETDVEQISAEAIDAVEPLTDQVHPVPSDAVSVIDAPEIDAPEIDAPEIDAPEIDAPEIDAPEIDAREELPVLETDLLREFADLAGVEAATADHAEIPAAAPVELPEAEAVEVASEVQALTPTADVILSADILKPIIPVTRPPLPDPVQLAAVVPQPAEPAIPDEVPAAVASIPEPADRAASSRSGAGGESGDQESATTGGGTGTASGGGDPGAMRDYITSLRLWLEKHREYPRRAKLRREEGTAMLSFVIDAQGNVMAHELAESTGHALLDKEVLAMMERAQPLPRPPDGVVDGTLTLFAPVQFILR